VVYLLLGQEGEMSAVGHQDPAQEGIAERVGAVQETLQTTRHMTVRHERDQANEQQQPYLEEHLVLELLHGFDGRQLIADLSLSDRTRVMHHERQYREVSETSKR
jgi:hypothetical protein